MPGLNFRIERAAVSLIVAVPPLVRLQAGLEAVRGGLETVHTTSL